MPYLLNKRVQELNIHPGAILDGDIRLKDDAKNPHIEDASHENLRYVKPASKNQFKVILERTLSNSVATGFGIQFADGQKHIPVGQQATCSIITIKIPQSALQIHEDKFKPGKIRASLTDSTGHSFRYLSITDRGFFDYAKKHQEDGKLSELQKFIQSQKEVYLRIGVGRRFKSEDRDGYWLQVNGIYTFPDFLDEIRSY